MEVPLTNGMNSDVHLEADLQYEATQHRAEVLDNLHKLRKENQFCDAILVIGRHEIPIHRAVVASSSTFLMELFEKYKNNNEEKEGLVKNMIKLKEMEHESFLYLLDYMYTGRWVYYHKILIILVKSALYTVVARTNAEFQIMHGM